MAWVRRTDEVERVPWSPSRSPSENRLVGREDLLPQVFAQIVRRLNAESSGSLDGLVYYLQRHIELDGDEHGAMAQRLVEELCGDDQVRWQTAEAAAVRSLLARKRLWDGIADEIKTKTFQTFRPGLS